tara:strand:+ start:66 stop:614 length:549 start_codon:yes stop_codon:yes gene_type:complete
MLLTHKHHIIPRHAGGTDDPSNLVELSVADHALAHLALYEEHGRWQDLIAFQGLSGQIGKEELIRKVQSLGSSHSNQQRLDAGIHNLSGDRNPSRKLAQQGLHHWQQDVGNRSCDLHQRELVSSGKHHWQTQEHAEEVGKRSSRLAAEGKVPIGTKSTCPHCGKVGQTTAMARWHFNNCKHL